MEVSNIATKDRLLRRAIKLLEQHKDKEELYPGEVDAELLAIEVVSYLGNIPYRDVINQFTPEHLKDE